MIRRFLLSLLLSRGGISIIDRAMRRVLRRFPKIVPDERSLSRGDRVCLACNSFVLEPLFLLWLYRTTEPVPISPSYVLFLAPVLLVVDDALYTVYHLVLHRNKTLFAWIHSRHHRLRHPHAGYVHAAMEHPLEMAGALSIHALVVHVLHADMASAGAHLVVKALASVANHSGRRLRWRCFDTLDHARHHAKLVSDYHQMIPFERLWR